MQDKTKKIIIGCAIGLAVIGTITAVVVNRINNSVGVLEKKYATLLEEIADETTEILIKKTANGRVVGSISTQEDIEKTFELLKKGPVVTPNVAESKERIAYDFAFLNKKETIAYTDWNFFVKGDTRIPITLTADEVNEFVKEYLHP